MSDQRSLLTEARRLLESGRPHEAEPRLRKVVATAPLSAEAVHLLGLALHETGRSGEGIDYLRRSIELAPKEPTYRRNLGLVLSTSNHFADAEVVLRELVARWPSDATAHSFLGWVLQQTGRLAESLPVHERAAALAPQDDGVLNNLGAARLAAGDRDAAVATLRRAAGLNPRNPMPWLNLGNALREAGLGHEARQAYARATSIAPGLGIAWHNAGIAAMEAGASVDALAAFRNAIATAPNEPAHWQAFADVSGPAIARGAQVSEDELVKCLERRDIDAAGLAEPAFAVLLRRPAFAALIAGDGPLPASAETLRVLGDRLFLDLLEGTLVPDARFESLATRLRRALLEAASVDDLDDEWLPLVAALALQCFANDYVFVETGAERVVVDELHDRLARADRHPAHNRTTLALLACYRPLASFVGRDEITTLGAPHAFVELVRRQLIEPRTEAKLAESLPALTPIRDGVSQAVRAMYEEHPYPKWRTAASNAGAFPVLQKLRALFPWLQAAATTFSAPPSILIPGCGTGRHAILAARFDPTSHVLAVDLSRSSLAYAARRARELGIENIEFAQADLLEIGAIGRKFEIIDCAGVLHHLADPIAGWRALPAVLAPNGFMRVALYSETARQAIVAARELIAAQGYAADVPGLRAARQAMLALPEEAPARGVIRSPDFWSSAGCRDLLFHVQEHRFTLPQIQTALDAMQLEFLGFEFTDQTVVSIYRAEFPEDSAARSLVNWAHFEERYPDTFAGMYQFWVRRRGL